MNELTVVRKTAKWQRLKPLVLDSVSSPITKRVYNMALDEFFAWYDAEPRAGFRFPSAQLVRTPARCWRIPLRSPRRYRCTGHLQIRPEPYLHTDA